jgi:hypothetical protein
MQAALSLSTLPENHPFYQKNQSKLLIALAQSAQLSTDEWNVAAVTLAAQSKTAQLFSQIAQEKRPNSALLASLALNTSGSVDEVVSVLASLQSSNLSDKDRAFVIKQLAQNMGKIEGKAIENQLESIEKNAQLGLLTHLASVRQKLKLKPAPQFLQYSSQAAKNVLNTSLPDSVRVQYLSLLDFVPFPQKSAILYECLKNNQPLKLQENVLRQLSNYREKEIGDKVVAMCLLSNTISKVCAP